MSTTSTFYFEDIFDSYSTFKEFTDGLNLYNTDNAPAEAFNQRCFELLYARYCGNSINYNIPQYFVYAFGVRYKDVFIKYFKQSEFIELISDLKAEDMAILNETISNGAVNPNTKPTEFWKPLGYISNQSATQIKSSKLLAYLNAINNMPTAKIDEFLANFVDLFTMFMPQNKYYY